MPLEVYSSADALKIVRGNKAFREWPNRQKKNRVEPIALPKFQPSFQLISGEKIFTIGSCFSRHIETQLDRLGFDIIVRRLLSERVVREDDPFIVRAPNVFAPPETPTIVNKYTPHSILNELRWALDPAQWPYPDPGAFYEIGPGKWQDANMNHTFPSTLDRERERRRIVLENARAIRMCRVVIITPGLVESWWDSELNDYVNHAPDLRFIQRNPGRFEFHVLSYDEVLQVFEETYALLRQHLCPDFRVLFTVSPVPLHVTFRDMDVMVANAYSKSVLRAATEEFCMRHENVDYFPSYESLTCSDRLVTWEDDLIHPTNVVVKSNVCRMTDAYLSPRLGEKCAHARDLQIEREAEDLLCRKNRLVVAIREEIDRLRTEIRAQTRIAKQLETQCEAQKQIIEMTRAQLKLSQDTTARYLRQILERDGILEPGQEVGSGVT